MVLLKEVKEVKSTVRGKLELDTASIQGVLVVASFASAALKVRKGLALHVRCFGWKLLG